MKSDGNARRTCASSYYFGSTLLSGLGNGMGFIFPGAGGPLFSRLF